MTQSRITGKYNLRPYEIDYSKPAMQVWKKLPEGFPAEVIDNTLYVSESPTTYHADVSGQLAIALWDHINSNGLGKVYVVPVDIYLSKRSTVVAPDICFISKSNMAIIQKKGLFGSPDLVIEILSPGTRKYDLATKKDIYERYGIREYWVIDPETKNTQGFVLRDGRYNDPLFLNSEIYIHILKKSFKF